MHSLSWREQEAIEGMWDGRDKDSPWPSGNRSTFYKHAFEVHRAEVLGKPIPAQVSRERWEKICAEEDAKP